MDISQFFLQPQPTQHLVQEPNPTHVSRSPRHSVGNFVEKFRFLVQARKTVLFHDVQHQSSTQSPSQRFNRLHLGCTQPNDANPTQPMGEPNPCPSVVKVENHRCENCASALGPQTCCCGPSSTFMKFVVWERWISITEGVASSGSLTTDVHV